MRSHRRQLQGKSKKAKGKMKKLGWAGQYNFCLFPFALCLFRARVPPLKGGRNSAQAAVAPLRRAPSLAAWHIRSVGRDIGLAESGFVPD